MSEAGDSLAARKAALREAMRAQRLALAPEFLRAANPRIAERVMALPEWRTARVVMGYLSMPGEASVDALLQAARLAGRRVCIPAPHGAPREYDPAWLPEDDGLQAGAWGIREPRCPEWVGGVDIDVVLVPGVAFDPRGGRLGHGRGFYDRMLARLGAHARCRIGVGFSFQLVEAVPCGTADVRMDAVVVETGMHRNGAARIETGKER